MLSSKCNCVLFIGYLIAAHLSLSAAEIGNDPIQDLAADAALKRIVEIEDKLVAIIENKDGIVPLGEAVNFDRDPKVTERLKREETILAYKRQAVEILGRIGSDRAI